MENGEQGEKDRTMNASYLVCTVPFNTKSRNRGIVIYSFIHFFLLFCPTNILSINGTMSRAKQGAVKKTWVVPAPRELPNGGDSYQTNYHTRNYCISTVPGAPLENCGTPQERDPTWD